MTAAARTVFLGSGAFAVPIVEALASAPDVELVGIVTAPARPSGRGLKERASPIGEWAASHKLPVMTPRRLRGDEALALVAALGPNLLILADYGRLVPPDWLDLPQHGALNVHPSLLPRHRGASPIPAAILAGDAFTGTSLMSMDTGIDTGPVLAQRAVPLRGDETSPELEQSLARVGAELLLEALPGWLRGDLQARPQAEDGASLTRPLIRDDGRLNAARPAVLLERQVRAQQPWPGSFLETSGGRLVVWRARAMRANLTGHWSALPIIGRQASHAGVVTREADASVVPPGTLVRMGDGLALSTSDGILELLEVQRPGGRRISGSELLRGRAAWIGERIRPRG